MKPELKTQWVEALRSGKYKQGRAMLNNGRGNFCCLGVLCDLIDPDGWKPLVGDDLEPTCYLHHYQGQSSAAALTEPVRAAGGICGKEERHIYKLILMNDSGVTFKKIAAFIERNF